MKCRKCHRGADEINGYLHRVNEKGVPGIWECRPYCNTDISQDEAVMAAITGESDSPVSASSAVPCPCPWCKAVPRSYAHYFEVYHAPQCFLIERPDGPTRRLIFQAQVPAWNTRVAPTAAHPDIEAFWTALDRSWNIEPREYFEKEAPKNGFGSPLAMAVHYMWKREVKDVSAAPADERISRIRERIERLAVSHVDLDEMKLSEIERGYEETIGDLIGDIRYLLDVMKVSVAQWRPIESVPKDGTRVLFYTPEDKRDGLVSVRC